MSQLPIRKVVLFKHGIAYVERLEEVAENVRLELQFRKSEMNDVLKSLTVLDLDGGRIASISYAAATPASRLLEDISFRVPEGDALLGLLEQLSGARVRLSANSETLEGVIAGVQRTQSVSSSGERVESKASLTLFVGGLSLRTFDVAHITNIELCDETLRKDLQQLLEVSFDSKKKDMKKLTIFANGEGKRRLLVAYAVESPVWKTSYRILVDDKALRIQGWAVVDNTQDEDWSNISLSLMSGLPISFVHDLYTPRYKKRPEVQVKEEEAYAPPVIESGACDEMAEDGTSESFAAGPAMAAMSVMPQPRMMARGAWGAGGGGAAYKEARQQARNTTAPVQTRTAEIGDLFEYEIAEPVTVRRNQSALVPIVNSAMEGRCVALYNQSVRDKNPMTAVFVKNTTGLTLEGGPMTVLQDEMYVGEAMLDTMKAGEERLVPYSVELSCKVRVEADARSGPVHQCRIASGYLYLVSYSIAIRHYHIDNGGKKRLELFVDHPMSGGTELVDTPKPYETTDNFRRFQLFVDAGKSTRFTVQERSATSNSWTVSGLNSELIGAWFSSKYITADVRSKLEEIVALQTKLAGIAEQNNRLARTKRSLLEENERLRSNLGALGQSDKERKMRDQYLDRMAQMETSMERMRSDVEANEAAAAALQAQVHAKISELSVSIDVK